jgi:hypothetical protein
MNLSAIGRTIALQPSFVDGYRADSADAIDTTSAAGPREIDTGASAGRT